MASTATNSRNSTVGGDLSTLILKGSIMSEKDAGFCSGEDDIDVDDVHSPTDASEDSIEVKVTPISPRNKNKRKCAEPRKVPLNESTGPLKKRIRRDITCTTILSSQTNENQNPFRPWSSSDNEQNLPYHPVYGYQPPPSITTQDEPLSLVKVEKGTKPNPQSTVPPTIRPKDFARFPTEDYHRVPPHPGVVRQQQQQQSSAPSSQQSESTTKFTQKLTQQQQKEHRNYKNMTRERRIEANARERTRVHTISAAFDTLRRAIPAYSHNQKLSKLSVLRIACSYILTLSRVAGTDYSADQSEPTLAHCVDLVSRTIQTEGKLRKKKDD